MVREDGYVSPLELNEPSWTDDTQVTGCSAEGCTKTFSFLVRKHHCRRCGEVFCDPHSNISTPILRMMYADPVRVCTGCAPLVKQENEFFKKDLAILQRGGSFEISKDGGEAALIRCKLSDDDSRLEFEPATIDPISAHAVHFIEGPKDLLDIRSKSAGSLAFRNADKEFIKRWRKAVKHMVRTLHHARAANLRKGGMDRKASSSSSGSAAGGGGGGGGGAR